MSWSERAKKLLSRFKPSRIKENWAKYFERRFGKHYLTNKFDATKLDYLGYKNTKELEKVWDILERNRERILDVLNEHNASPFLLTQYPDWAQRIREEIGLDEIPFDVLIEYIEYLWDTTYKAKPKDSWGRIR